jgi:hypothetical protein
MGSLLTCPGRLVVFKNTEFVPDSRIGQPHSSRSWACLLGCSLCMARLRALLSALSRKRRTGGRSPTGVSRCLYDVDNVRRDGVLVTTCSVTTSSDYLP